MRFKFFIAVTFIFGLLLGACSAAPAELDLQDSAPQDVPRADDSPIQPESPVGEKIDLGVLFVPFWESWEILHENFVSQPLDDDLMLAGAIEGLINSLEAMGVNTEDLPETTDEQLLETLAIRAKTPREVEALFIPFWKIWHAGENAKMDAGMTYENMMQSALHGMVDSLGDPHTFYVDPDQYRQVNIPLEGEYEGIGAWVDITGDYPAIIAPIPDAPADRAGLKPKDLIIGVDGEDMTGIDGNLVIRKVLGPAGTNVVLTIMREGVAEPFDVEITRELVVLPVLESRVLENNIGYIHLFNFGEKSDREFRLALTKLIESDVKGLIIDLRFNGGGFLHAAIAITSEFFEEGVVVYEVYGDESRDTSEVQPGGIAIDIPLIILINEGSASASEIVAGAIQDRERGILVGTTSFGKGSVQIPFVLTDDRGGLRVTVASWLTPNERLIHNIGLTPDYIVEMTDADIKADLDPQLDKAIELMLDLIR